MSEKNMNITKFLKMLQAKDESGVEMLRLMQLYLLGRSETDEQSTMISNIPSSFNDENGFRAIGTWHPVQENDEITFKRKEQADSVFWESTRQKITLKKELDQRVCVIGESAAAGMFFTPYITPAKALENYLKTDKKYTWEVIDLTRNCMNAGALLETCKSALQLQPDYIIIIAGNNWFSDIMIEHKGSLYRRRDYATALEKGGMEAVIQTYQKKARELAKNVMDQIEKLALESSARFVFAIPALNYSSWERRIPLHWIGNEGTMEWYEYYKIATESLDNKEYEKALMAGKKMFEIDGGKNPTSNCILAKCYVALGDEEKAYNHYVLECDYSLLFDEMTSFPAVPSFVRKEYGHGNLSCPHIHFLDFENVLQEYYGSKILGTEVFVDYCHLNPDGFHIVMAPVAYLMLQKNESLNKEWISLAQNTSLSKVEPVALAVSYFCAALYNSHLNRPISNDLDVNKYSYFFQKAIDSDKSIIELMKLYVRGRSCEKGLGFTLSKAGQNLFELMNSPLDFPVAQEAPGVDALTIESICNTLERNGCDVEQLLLDYQFLYIQLLEEGIDLTEPAYVEWINSHVKMSMDSENGTRRRLPYYKSWWPSSYFTLISNGKDSLEVRLTCRLSGDASGLNNRNVKVAINGQEVKTVSVGTTWCKHNFVIPSYMVKRGFNRISVDWPIIYQNENKKLGEIIKRYLKGLEVDFFPVLGEIHSFTVEKIE